MARLFSFILTFLLFYNRPLSAVEACPAHAEAERAYEAGDHKRALLLYTRCLKEAKEAEEYSLLELRLAQVLLQDQEVEQAFKMFLAALDHATFVTPPEWSANEQKLYGEALQLYLSHSALDAQQTANKIRQEYVPVMVLHPNYYMLNFLVSSAYANLGMYDEFFSRFYESYRRYPDSFMAYKTKAMLHIKLLERAPTEEEREPQRAAILSNAREASAKNPCDSTLYKILIGFSPQKEKEKQLVTILEKIITDNIIIPRGDLPFYVNEALRMEQYALAERFLARAREWYASSQIITSLQEIVDQQTKKR